MGESSAPRLIEPPTSPGGKKAPRRSRGCGGEEAAAASLRAVTYGRVSTKQQSEEGKSLLRQKMELHDFVARKAWEHVGHFEDPGVSGGKLDRPELSRVRDLIRAGQVDILVFASLDRLSRGIFDFLVLLEEAEKNNVRFVALDATIDTTTPQGRAFAQMAMVMAEFERGMIAKRVKEGKNAARKRGEWVGGKPGYGLVFKKGKGLVQDPIKALHIKELFQDYLASQSTATTAKHLREKFPTGRKWTPSNVSGALRNVYYAGKVPQDDGTVIDGKHEAIVDWTTFNQAQEILKANTLGNRSKTKTYKHGIAIVDLMECSCGSGCTVYHAYNRTKVKGGKRFDYLQCKLKAGKGCEVDRILGHKLESACIDVVAQAARKPEVISRALRELQTFRNEELKEAKRDLAQLHGERMKLQSQTQRIVDLVKDSDNPALQQELARLESASQQLDRRISQLEAISPSPAPSQRHLTAIRKALEDFTVLYGEIAFVERKELFHAFFEKIIWHGSHAELVFADGRTKRIMPLIDGKFSTENLLESLPGDMRLKTRRMDPEKECVAVGCAKPRHAGGLCRQHYQRTRTTGKPRAKLTDEQVAEIRRLKKQNPKLTTRKLGEMFGISHNNVAVILRGDTWK